MAKVALARAKGLGSCLLAQAAEHGAADRGLSRLGKEYSGL